MLYTLTTNPAIDMNIRSCRIEKDKVNRTFDAVYTPNGKGLNVSFVLGHFGIKTRILGFFGGFSGKYIVGESENRGFEVIPVWVEDTTRINIFLNDGSAEYKFVNEGSYVENRKQEELLEKIREADDMQYLVIGGSLPRGISEEYYDTLFEICRSKDVDVILDISSRKLSELLCYRPLLIKPNDEELEEIFGIQVKTEEDMIAALEELHRRGAQNIFLTLGSKGSYFYNGKAIYSASALKIELLSSACAGDSALGAFLSIWLQDREKVEEALKNAAAAGANAAESNGIGTLEKVGEYRQKIQVRKVR
ncbi:1-phosphofructokinase family hexose kinase [Anaerostipes sp.]|uniref:1-phosphofructokinase family hexose kinase n=1 Tax=Anaerostipes sp. TaxID=1872530 RepID=UPI0025807DB3|nr:1-phosphofructokinase family hexose kinase [Anaerostipes sp.]